MSSPLPRPKIKATALVRDKHGRPKVDDPSTLPSSILKMLSEQEKRELGLETSNGNPDYCGS